MPSPKISVIVATYNVEAYIVETMECLLGQAFAPYEIIIINDGSTDGTLALLESRYGDNSTVKIVTQANQGIGPVRKTGFDLATGDYLFYCDPDDVVSLALFEEFATALAANPAMELFYFSKRSFSDSPSGRKFFRRDTAPSREGVYARGIDLLEDLILQGKYKAATWQYIFKRSMTDRFEVSFEGVAHEDHVFSMNVYLHSELTYAIKADRYFQRVRPGSLTNSLKDEYYVLTNYDTYRWTIDLLKAHLSRFSRPQQVALVYMRRGVMWSFKRSINNRVRLPDRIFALTRQDAKDCGVSGRGGVRLIAPWLEFLMMKVQFELRGWLRRIRGRAV